MPSSPTPPPDACLERVIGLVQVLADLPDPRRRRGIRYRLVGVVAVALSAVLGGARSYAAIGQWAAELTSEQLCQLGLTRSQAPDTSTFRRLFARLDAAVLDTLIGAFLWTRAATVAGRRVIAIDGKTVRGARTATTAAPHLVAAFDQATGTVLGQLATAAKSNEIPTVRTLLATFDLTDVVVTVDAMHTQTDTAAAIVGGGGDYVFTVKANQPTLYAACKNLPWRDVPAHSYFQKGHGRRVRRTIKVLAAPACITFDGAAQVAQIRRTVTCKGQYRGRDQHRAARGRGSARAAAAPARRPAAGQRDPAGGEQDHGRGRLRDHLRGPPRRTTGHARGLGPGPLGHRGAT